MKRTVRKVWFVLMVLAVSGFGGAVFASSQVFDVNNEFYPYYPSLIKWNKSNATFTPPEVCNGCHSDR